MGRRNAGTSAEGAEEIQGRTQKAQRLRRSRKRNTKIVWKRLEPVFMRVAGHKWLGRRMGAGCRYFAALLWAGMNAEANAEGAEVTQKPQKELRFFEFAFA